jgi:hypothetical protein
VNSTATQNRERSQLYWQGDSIGRAEAEALLVQAVQQKGNTPLTAKEIRQHCYYDVMQRQSQEWQQGMVEDDWFEGWCAGFTLTCLDAEKDAPDPDGIWKPRATFQPKPTPENAVAVTFRKATLEVQDPIQFFEGVRRGQRAMIEDDERPTVTHLFQELAVDIVQHTPKSVTLDWRLGYLLGRADAILRDRHYYPAASVGMRGESCM